MAAAAAACCTYGVAAPLGAQSGSDSTALATATVAVLRDSLLRGRGARDAMIFRSAGSRFDTAVARAMRLNGPLPRGHKELLELGGVAIEGDTASVLVVTTLYFAEPPEQLQFDEYRWRYVFARVAGGWRFIRSQLVRQSVGGSVRG
jgi:hypothetical protein